MDDITYMNMALELAREAAAEGEVPVGCVIVCKDQVVGKGRNHRETGKNALGHAEIQAIDEACRALGGWRLWECTLYVTLEPCAMCAGAILNARVGTVVYGARDPDFGAVGGVINLFEEAFPHRPRVYGGLMAEQCAEPLRQFFAGMREA